MRLKNLVHPNYILHTKPATPLGLGGSIPPSISASAEKALRSHGWNKGDDGPKGSAMGKEKIKKTEVEKLKEGVWETWSNLSHEVLIMKQTRKTITWRRQRGKGLNIQKWLRKTGIEFHWPGYQFLRPGTELNKRLARGDPCINQLDKIAKQHNIDYAQAKNLQDKWIADTKMIAAVKLPEKKTLTERLILKII